jgi:hypothetical protein
VGAGIPVRALNFEIRADGCARSAAGRQSELTREQERHPRPDAEQPSRPGGMVQGAVYTRRRWMAKSIALVLVALLLCLLAWVLFQSSDISIVVNGQKLVGPAKLAAEGWGMLVAIVALFCAAILLAFVFAGIGLFILGAVVLGGLFAVWFAFPFLLPLLVPLFVVWIFVALVHRGGKPRS